MIAALNRVSPIGETYLGSEKTEQTAPDRPSDISFAVKGASTRSAMGSTWESGRARVVFLSTVGLILFATTVMALHTMQNPESSTPVTNVPALSVTRPAPAQPKNNISDTPVKAPAPAQPSLTPENKVKEVQDGVELNEHAVINQKSRIKSDPRKQRRTSQARRERKESGAKPDSAKGKVRFLKGKASTSFVSDYGD
jgi:hypothetical protein